VLSSTVLAFGTGVIRPTLTSLITQHARPHEQGAVLGVTQSLMSIASVVTPIVSGMLIERRLLTLWAWLPAVVAVVGLTFARGRSPVPAPDEVEIAATGAV
jgi:MFS family permease